MLPMLLGAIGGPLLQGALTGTALGALTATQLGGGLAGLVSLAQGDDIGTAALNAFSGGSGAGAVGNLAKTGAAAAGNAGAGVGKTLINPEYFDKAGNIIESSLPTAPSRGALTSFVSPPVTGMVPAASAANAPFSLSNVGTGLKDLFTEGGAQRFADITGKSALSSVGVPAAGAAIGLAGAMAPKPQGAAPMSFGFGPFVPFSELRRRASEDRMGYAEGGIAALNPMSGMFDARTNLPEYREPLGAYKKGGYLDGPGDGMSDDIPATIEGKQPARLADGEFVVPADVVSHLGNGSTKAGAKRLYAMMDKVRKARTGTEKQGKQIKAERYLPA